MKKLNATNAIVILSLGLTLSVFVAGCGGGNDTNELKVKNGIYDRCKTVSNTSSLYKKWNCSKTTVEN